MNCIRRLVRHWIARVLPGIDGWRIWNRLDMHSPKRRDTFWRFG